MKVTEMFPEKDHVHDVLGVDEHRLKMFVLRLEHYLTHAFTELQKKNTEKVNITKILSHLTTGCESINEIGLYCFLIGREVSKIVEQRRTQYIMEKIKTQVLEEIDEMEKIDKQTRSQNPNLN